jgi:hypothetical protein
MNAEKTVVDADTVRSLAWLADAPLFIDGQQVAALYDAVVKPEYKEASVTLSLKNLKSIELTGKAGVEGEISAAAWLKTIFPFLDAKVKASAEAGATAQLEKEKGTTVELHPIDTPQRQLVQLALHYLANLPGRSLTVTQFSKADWIDPKFVSELPRGLVFVDFPEKTQFIPMAAELQDGSVQLIYPSLEKAFAGPKLKPPAYPEPAYYIGKEDQLAKARTDYWNFFQEHFSSTLSMEAIETTLKGGLVRWIDYRIPLGSNLPYLHMHVQGRGDYATGTFAYNLVKRGFRHGLRIVGTMKSEPGINALAIFEK